MSSDIASILYFNIPISVSSLFEKKGNISFLNLDIDLILEKSNPLFVEVKN